MKDMAKMGRAMHADASAFEMHYLELYLIFSVPTHTFSFFNLYHTIAFISSGSPEFPCGKFIRTVLSVSPN